MLTTTTWTHRQREVLATALEILAREGSRALTMKRVGQRLGVTEAAIYRHFDSKHHLLVELYAYVREGLLAKLAPILGSEMSPVDRVRVFIRESLRYFLTHRGVNLILLAESIYHHDDELRKAMLSIFTAYKTLVETLLQAGMASGHFCKDLDTDICATCLIGMIQGALTRHFLTTGGPEAFEPSEAAEAISRCFLRGVLPPKNT
ncbi:TetR/AcrR family transcriptional regulator [Desulfohalobiaceae bacterium Ax17]|uniref:TetR/AcrR family transcriptional regulator n=1 Tax=Desulfovulcanus ferrireducens TaxID=2831190 RepID=UPI00207BB016|nr:TetR/AcrR family transcriptional regulator [Desulfovulcanus ferrireducens]MBT8763219.1 TetR/AcrR family transcriptional regulator [Desulfovulcanus ferrireducens]